MKTKTLFFALLAAASTTAFAFGSDEPGMTVVSSRGSEVFKVIYKGATTGKVKLNILDVRGNVIHTEVYTGLNGFICPVNFKGLSAGQYTIEVVDNRGKYSETITYKPSHELKSVHVSKLSNQSGKFLLAVANAQNEPIRVNIYDANEQLIYTETSTVKGDFAKVFKMENPFGRYSFEITDDAGNKKYFAF